MHKSHEEKRKSKGTPLAMKAAISNFYLLSYVSGRMFYNNNQKHQSVDWIAKNNYSPENLDLDRSNFNKTPTKQ